ncbi:hypothetical protein [Streptomyces sp. NPDC008092]|uniref:hypothetical protein n=1 Tax=Streptomyces sp. NPDC008092 TaxID=3364808 RepID=UPI0036E9379B
MPTATADTEPTTQTWPEGTTARFLTRAGILTHDLNATVDIHDHDDRSRATCRPCGWTKSHGLTYRDQVLEWAQQHADNCSALAQPTA